MNIIFPSVHDVDLIWGEIFVGITAVNKTSNGYYGISWNGF